MFATNTFKSTQKLKSITSLLTKSFSYDRREILRMQDELMKKFNSIRMFTENPYYTYEPPNLYLDKETGEVKMREKDQANKKKILKTPIDLEN